MICAETEHIAVQSVANEQPVESDKAKKQRKVPGLVRDRNRSLNILFTAPCDENMLAVAMVSDIHYWTTPDENGVIHTNQIFDGHEWAARSIEFWKIHFGLNPKSTQKVRTALAAVKASGLVVMVDRHFNGNMWPHFRMSDKGLALVKEWGVKNNTQSVSKNKVTGVKNNTPLTNASAGGVDSSMGGVKNNTPGVLKTTLPLHKEIIEKDKEEKTNTKSAQALPDAILTSPETSKASQAETKTPKAKTGTLKISVDFETLFKKEFPTLYVPLGATDRELLGNALHALHDAGEENYTDCLLFAATAYGYDKFQGFCNAAGVFPHLKMFPEPKRIRENLGLLRQVFHYHLEREAEKAEQAAAKKTAVPVAALAPKQPEITYKQAVLKSDFCKGYATLQKNGEPITAEVEAIYQKLQGPLTEDEWQALHALVYAPVDLSLPTESQSPKPATAPMESAATPPAEAHACADIPKPTKPVMEPIIEPITQTDLTGESDEVLKKMGQSAANPVTSADIKRWHAEMLANAAKHAAEEKKKKYHA